MEPTLWQDNATVLLMKLMHWPGTEKMQSQPAWSEQCNVFGICSGHQLHNQVLSGCFVHQHLPDGAHGSDAIASFGLVLWVITAG